MPPDPPAQPKGAYVRDVSRCGFTSGLAFVNIPCGYTSFVQGDAGNMYFELTGFSGSSNLMEGGLQYNNDFSIQPYVRSFDGYDNTLMTNYQAHYTCGSDLGILSGATWDGSMTYTLVGQLPLSITPETNFYNNSQFTMDNESWLFHASPSGVFGPSTDNAGYHTGCGQCTISRMSTIAQGNGVTQYSYDGSYFGVDRQNHRVAIHWMQVAFGDMGTDCVTTSNICTFYYSPVPYAYALGQERFPNSSVVGNIQHNSLTGPYESYDGIDLSLDGGFTYGAETFNEPLPPPACSVDALGFCAIETFDSRTDPTTDNASNWCIYEVYDQKLHDYITHHKVNFNITYATYGSGTTFYGAATQSNVYSGTQCGTLSATWSPAEPKAAYSDANLP